jgi:dienelactone hydrolase
MSIPRAAVTLSMMLSFVMSGALVGAAVAQPMQIPKPVLTDPAPDGVRIDQSGVIGNYFGAPQAGRRPGVILLGGSEGGLGPGAVRQAKLLAQEGFDVLQLAYFGAPGQPAALANVPVETFSRGLAWLRARPEVEPDKIGLVGSSKGAEAALLFASRDPEVKAVVVGMPSSVVWPGITYTADPQPSWTSGGQTVGFLPYAVEKPFSIYNAYNKGLAALPQHPDAAIEVEHINGPILLICGKADTLWPSCPMSEQIVARLKSRGFKYDVKLLAYDDAGHGLFGPPVPPSNPAYPPLGSLGGSPAGNNTARQDDWPKSVAFLHVALGS